MATLSSSQRSFCPGERILTPQRVPGLKCKGGAWLPCSLAPLHSHGETLAVLQSCFTQSLQNPVSERVLGSEASTRVWLAEAGKAPRVRLMRPLEDLARCIAAFLLPGPGLWHHRLAPGPSPGSCINVFCCAPE